MLYWLVVPYKPLFFAKVVMKFPRESVLFVLLISAMLTSSAACATRRATARIARLALGSHVRFPSSVGKQSPSLYASPSAMAAPHRWHNTTTTVISVKPLITVSTEDVLTAFQNDQDFLTSTNLCETLGGKTFHDFNQVADIIEQAMTQYAKQQTLRNSYAAAPVRERSTLVLIQYLFAKHPQPIKDALQAWAPHYWMRFAV